MPRHVIERQAKILAKDNREFEPEITAVYWFPDDDEVRLVEVIPSVPVSPDKVLHPFFFRPSPEDDLPSRSGIALIAPEEEGQIILPGDWGSWSDAIKLEVE